jgi:hypothetical protein
MLVVECWRATDGLRRIERERLSIAYQILSRLVAGVVERRPDLGLTLTDRARGWTFHFTPPARAMLRDSLTPASRPSAYNSTLRGRTVG